MGNSRSIVDFDRLNQTKVDLNDYECSNRGLILPLISEYTWSVPVRVIIYFTSLMYLFLGIAIIADIFMCSIEKITSKTTKIKYPDASKPNGYGEKEVKIWNDTVANLTLMALGSSAPEILLSVIEICGNEFLAGDLGPGTIVGSAAFNLLVITAICVIAIEPGKVSRIKNFKVFLTTTVYSIFAYLWLYVVLVLISPNEVTIWEAFVTLLAFPVLVMNSYMAEKNFFMKKSKKEQATEDEEKEFNELNDMSAWQRKKVYEEKNVSAEEVLEFTKEMGDMKGISDEDKARLLAAKVLKSKDKSRIYYRINGIRSMTGSRKNEIELSSQLEKMLNDGEARHGSEEDMSLAIKANFIKDLSDNGKVSVIEFAASSYAVLENEQVCRIVVERYGKIDQAVTFRVETIDGTAEAGEDYHKIDDILTMGHNQMSLPIDVKIIDDNQWEPDETFFVKLSIVGDTQRNVRVGHKAICMVTIIDDDEPGEIEFLEPVSVIKESQGVFEVKLERKNGADGIVSVDYKTTDINAISYKDYIPKSGTVEFKHGEQSKTIPITIIDDKTAEKDESFSIELFNPKGGVKMGRFAKSVITIINDDDLQNINARLANLINANLDEISYEKKTWPQQFVEAMNVNSGDVENAKRLDYIMHFLAFPWKVMFAFVPPPHYLGGWLCFFCSLVVIGVLTAIVGDAAAIMGCLVGLKDSVTAITFVAMGTSLPDTFASRIAAQKEKTADNAIGNVTGSNSVNVFLGLGLPWVMASCYWAWKGLPFTVKAGDLTFSVAVYTICSAVCFFVIFLRRYTPALGRAELGGPAVPKYVTAALFIGLWFIYIAMSSLNSYGVFSF